MYYIQEIDKPNKILKTFNILKLQQNKIILPIQNECIKLKKAEALANKTNALLQKTNSRKVVISKIIHKQTQYINELYAYNLDIADGKWLFELLSYEVLAYLMDKNKLKKQEMQITLLINQVDSYIIEIIKMLAKEYKSVNIVTNHIEKFKNIEAQIFNQEGIMITIANNKKKSLAKAKIILNMDFTEELINQYNIYEEAIIINIQGNVKIKKKRFNGICINDYEIQVSNQEIEDRLYYTKEIYEAQMYKKQPFKDAREKIIKDGVNIMKLFAINVEI